MNSPSKLASDDKPMPLSRATLERWFKTTPAILHSVDSDGRLIAVSDAWLAKFGYGREEVLGRKSVEFLTPESRAYALGEVVSEFYRTGRRENIAYQMVCKDGRVLDVLLSAVLDPGDAEHGACSLAVITDVTELRTVQRKLAESQALYEGIVEDQTDLVSLAKPDGELTFVNHAYAQQYDRAPHELIGTNFLDFVPEEVRGSVSEQVRNAAFWDATVQSENQVVSHDGRKRWIAWTNRAIVDHEGRVVSIHSVGRDIDRRVYAEERLKESEARYRLLADNASDIVILVRSDGKRVYVSPACNKMLGWTPEEMLEMTTADIIHPEDLSKVQQDLLNGHDASVTMTYRVRRKDETYIWIETAAQSVEMPGELPHRLLVVRDIQVRYEAEQRLRESEAQYRLLADNASDMVFHVDRELVRRYVSPACQDILGYDPSDLIGARSLEQCHPDDAHIIIEASRAMLAGEVECRTLTSRSRHRDGHWVWLENRARALRDLATGEVTGILGVVRDISERVEAERRVTESEAAYRLLADNGSDMVIQYDRELVRRYVSPASKDILGYEPSELVNGKALDVCHPEDLDRAAAAFRALRTGEAERQTLINRSRRRDGRWIWSEMELKALREPKSGEFDGVVGSVRDISKRKAIEDELAEATRRLEILATLDGLTGLANRRKFDERFDLEFRRAQREGESLALIMIDVDHFKSFNDHYGHLVGDVCLKKVAELIGAATRRPADLAARYGGEEFVVLLPNTSEAGAAEVAERIRLAVRELGVANASGIDRIVTISVGVVSSHVNGSEGALERHLQLADRALYAAKNAGRDVVFQASWLSTEALPEINSPRCEVA